MKVKVFTVAYNTSSGGFDDEEMQAFKSSREVLELREHFFTHEGCPVWAVMLSYRDLGEPTPWERERVILIHRQNNDIL
jgi:hypothetical protein